MRNVSIVVNARLQSSRLPRKMVRPFGDTCLLKISLERLANTNVKNKYFAAIEPELLEIYRPFENEIKLLNRSPESVKPSSNPLDFSVSFAHYKDIADDYIMSANACLPFVKTETYENAIKFFVESDCRTLTAVKKSGNIFFDKNKKPINLSNSRNATTQGNAEVYEMAHIFHIFDKHQFIRDGYFWDYSYGNPEFYEVSHRECFDVDTMEEFDICEKLYIGGYKA